MLVREETSKKKVAFGTTYTGCRIVLVINRIHVCFGSSRFEPQLLRYFFLTGMHETCTGPLTFYRAVCTLRETRVTRHMKGHEYWYELAQGGK